jgi:hypothetical protein
MISAIYAVEEIGEGERILPFGIVEKFVRGDDGTMQPLTEGSTRPIAEVRTHAGIAKVRRFSFGIV